MPKAGEGGMRMAGPTSATPFFRRVLREPTFLVQKMLHVLSGDVIQPTEDERRSSMTRR